MTIVSLHRINSWNESVLSMKNQSTEETASAFNRDGFVIVRNVFSETELVKIDDHLSRFVIEVAPTLPPGEVYFEDDAPDVLKSAFRLNEHDPFFAELRESHRIREIVSAIFDDPDIVSDGITFFGKAAGSGSQTVAHQDNGFQVMVPPEGLTATIALDTSTTENGVLCCLRGSHKLGLLPHAQSGIPGFSRKIAEPLDRDAFPEVALCMQPGDVAFHHIDSVHYSGENRSARSRRQLGILCFSSRAKRDEKAFAAYKQGLNELHESKLKNSGNKN